MMEVIGWVGSILILAVYALNSYQRIRSDSVVFYTMNILGGILLTVYSWHKDAGPNIFINLVWVIIAIPALMRVIKGIPPRRK
jgi:hypothetical protein